MTNYVVATIRAPSALRLARGLGYTFKRASELKTRSGDRILNWGSTQFSVDSGAHNLYIWNYPACVERAVRKDKTLELLHGRGVPAVPYTRDPDTAYSWHADRKSVYARQLTRGYGGRGIELIRGTEGLSKEDFLARVNSCRLFTRYVKPTAEYRVHVFEGRVIDFACKKRRKMADPPSQRFWVRSYSNGWIMAREGVDLPEAVEEAAIRALPAIGLQFGALDILYLDRANALVLEINTAPGIQGTTLERYIEAFSKGALNDE